MHNVFDVYKSDHPDAPQHHTLIVISNQKDSFDHACHILSLNNFSVVYFKESHAVINSNTKIQNSHSVVSAISSGNQQFNELFPSKYKRNFIQVI
jgi:hypothetical protein